MMNSLLMMMNFVLKMTELAAGWTQRRGEELNLPLPRRPVARRNNDEFCIKTKNGVSKTRKTRNFVLKIMNSVLQADPNGYDYTAVGARIRAKQRNILHPTETV